MRKQYESAGKAVKLKKNLAPEANGRDISGREFIIEDWAENVLEAPWATSNFAGMNYLTRVLASHASSKYVTLPENDDVLYGKIGVLGFCVHRLEIDDSDLP